MDPTGSFSPGDSRDLPGTILVDEEGMSGTILILPLVEIREAERLIAQRRSLEGRTIQHLSSRKSRHDGEKEGKVGQQDQI
jgi:hypothetical protein